MFIWNLSDIKNKTLKNKLIEQNWRCYYCGEYLGTGQHKPTRDHVIPRSKGGETGPSNIVASCFKCNQEKGDKIIGQERTGEVASSNVGVQGGPQKIG